MNTARRLSNQQFYRTSNFYYYQYEIEKNFFLLDRHEFKRVDRKNVEEIVNNLDYFYLAEKLKYYCTVLSQQRLSYLILTNCYLLKRLFTILKNTNLKNIPPIAIYYQIYLTLIETENEDTLL